MKLKRKREQSICFSVVKIAHGLDRDFSKDHWGIMCWKQLNVFHCIGLGSYLNSERFVVLLVKSRAFCIHSKGLVPQA